MNSSTEIKLLLQLQGDYYRMIEVCDDWINKNADCQWWIEKKKQCQVAITDIRIKISSLKNEGLPAAVKGVNMILDSIFPTLKTEPA